MTAGVHHVGLAVSQLEESAAFFTKLLGFREVRRDDNYPAIFVSDDTTMITLWQVADPGAATPFDRRANIGLHHLAIKVESLDMLQQIHQKLTDHGMPIEFAPELLRNGPAQHMMCAEPSGIRIELIWPGN